MFSWSITFESERRKAGLNQIHFYQFERKKEIQNVTTIKKKIEKEKGNKSPSRIWKVNKRKKTKAKKNNS